MSPGLRYLLSTILRFLEGSKAEKCQVCVRSAVCQKWPSKQRSNQRGSRRGASYRTSAPSHASLSLSHTHSWSCLRAFSVLIYSAPRSYSEVFFSPKSSNFLYFLTKNISSVIGRGLLLQVAVFLKPEKCQACYFQSDLHSSSVITKQKEQRC